MHKFLVELYISLIRMVKVTELVENFEEESNKNPVVQSPKKKERWGKKIGKTLKYVLSSRYGGILVSIAYGTFLYYYLTFLVLNPYQEPILTNKNSSIASNITSKIDDEQKCSGPVSKIRLKNAETLPRNETEQPLELHSQNHLTGAGIGLGVSVTLAATSVFSTHTRCAMMLIVPGIFAGRGRAFLLTAAAGILIDGPLDSINYNVEQVVDSLACMYAEMTTLACRYQTEFKTIFESVGDILKQIHGIIQRQREALAEQGEKLTKEAQAAKEEAERQLKELRKSLEDLKKVIDTPGSVLNTVCNGANSVISSVGDFVSDDLGGILKKGLDFFGLKRRKKRESGCGIPPVVPDVNIKSPSLEGLKKWVSGIKPDLDVLDLDSFGDFTDALQSQSISKLRENLTKILKNIFVKLKEYSEYFKKIFYIGSLFLIIMDAIRYMTKYYSDDSFDNMFIDNNLKNLWRNGQKERLTPLRNWELREKYQISASVKISKQEGKRILIQAIPTLLFTATAIAIMTADYALANLLDLLLQHGQFGISFKGMQQDLNLGNLFGEVEKGRQTLASLELEAFDLSTEPCLPRAKRTKNTQLGLLWFLIIICLFSCLFDAYASRWRPMICNVYYPHRAEFRGNDLYRRILAGRGQRRFQLKLVIQHELSRRSNLINFSWWSKLWGGIRKKTYKRVDDCPGCFLKMKDVKIIHLQTKENEAKDVELCGNCFLDY